MKKSLAFVLALLMALSFVACSNGTTGAANPPSDSQQAAQPTQTAQPTGDTQQGEQDEKLVIALSVQNLANVFWVSWSEAMQRECEELGYELIVNDAAGDVANQISAFENWIVQEVDAIIVAPADAGALQPSVDEAMTAGIPVINAATRLERYTAYVGVDQYTYGYNIGQAAANWINANLAEKAEVKCCLLNDPTQTNMITRSEGIVAGLTENAKNAVIVAEQKALTADDGVTAAETVLQATPDIDCFVGITDASMLGAYEAIKGAGIDSSKMCLVACDGTSEALTLIKDGTCYRATVAIDIPGTAHLNLWQAIDAAHGKTVEDVKTQTTPVTSENVDEWGK